MGKGRRSGKRWWVEEVVEEGERWRGFGERCLGVGGERWGAVGDRWEREEMEGNNHANEVCARQSLPYTRVSSLCAKPEIVLLCTDKILSGRVSNLSGHDKKSRQGKYQPPYGIVRPLAMAAAAAAAVAVRRWRVSVADLLQKVDDSVWPRATACGVERPSAVRRWVGGGGRESAAGRGGRKAAARRR